MKVDVSIHPAMRDEQRVKNSGNRFLTFVTHRGSTGETKAFLAS